MRTQISAEPTLNLSPVGAASLLSASGALILWLFVLARQAPRLAAGAHLCGEASQGTLSLLGHCPACLPAALLTTLSLGLAFIPRRTAAARATAYPIH